MSFKKLAALFSITAATTYGIVLACGGDYDWMGFEDSSFTPEAFVKESYAPLFYTPYTAFYGPVDDEPTHNSRFNSAVIADWSTFLEGRISDEDLTFLMLADSGAAVVSSVNEAIEKKQTPTGKFSRLNLRDAKTRSFFEFLGHAKTIEVSSTAVFASWQYNPGDIPPVNAETIARVEARYTRTSDPFLKNRYWFQTVKAYFYSDNRQSVIPFFEKTQAEAPRNTLYYRALAYVAGAHYRNRDYAMSNYLFSIVFDKCPELRTDAAFAFHPAEDADKEASLAMAKSPEEKAAFWALYGYYTTEENAIREIYKVHPASPHLDFLLTRLINKREHEWSDMALANAGSLKRPKHSSTDSVNMQLISQIAREGKVANPFLWNSAAGYLNTFAGDFAKANTFFEKAKKYSIENELAVGQLRLLKLINTLASTVRMDQQAERVLLPELDWLYNTGHLYTDGELRYTGASAWTKRYIGALYRQQQNFLFAELFNNDHSFYSSHANCESMTAFLRKSDKTAWEKLAASVSDVTLEDIHDYEAVSYAYEEDLDKAIAMMEKAGAQKDVVLLGNPFNGKIKDCHDCDHAAPQKVKYTRLDFLKKLKEMKANIGQGNDVYNNALLVANAYYNMTYHGNARVFYYGRIMKELANQTLDCTTARKYYQKAFEAATNDEQRAKCTYMLAKCERNAFYNEIYLGTSTQPSGYFPDLEGFKKLKTDYSNTRYYQEVIKECGYFRNFLEE